METPAQYGADRTEIRRECLLAFGDGWELPTAAEIRTVIKLAGLTGAEVARLVGLTDGRTVRRWTGGDSPIPFAAWALLCHRAGFGEIWATPHGAPEAPREQTAYVEMSATGFEKERERNAGVVDMLSSRKTR